MHLNLRMLAFTAVVSCATAIVFGLLPALRSARPNLVPALKDAPALNMRTSGFRLGRSLVIGQIALSLVLLVAAGLFVRSLMNLRSIDLGFNPERVLVLRVDSSAAGAKVPLEERRNIYARLIERAESVPGVRGASLSFVGCFPAGRGATESPSKDAPLRRTSPNEPSPTRLPRDISRSWACRCFAGVRSRIRIARTRHQSPSSTKHLRGSSSTIRRRSAGGSAWARRRKIMMEIVGVVGDAKYRSIRESAVPMLYVPFTQYDGQLGQMQVRTAARSGGVVFAAPARARQRRRENGDRRCHGDAGRG